MAQAEEKIKMDLEIKVHSIELKITEPKSIKVIWTREGKGKLESTPKPFNPDTGSVVFSGRECRF